MTLTACQPYEVDISQIGDVRHHAGPLQGQHSAIEVAGRGKSQSLPPPSSVNIANIASWTMMLSSVLRSDAATAHDGCQPACSEAQICRTLTSGWMDGCTWTGHAAASPRAQMVWPSICFVTSHSMSISSTRASPFFMRVMMSYSQGAPSLQWHPSHLRFEHMI